MAEDQDPIEVQLNWNSKEFMQAFQEFLAGGEQADEQLDKLKEKFSKVTKEQSAASKTLNNVSDSIKEVNSTTKSLDKDLGDFGINKKNVDSQQESLKALEEDLKNFQKTADSINSSGAQTAAITKTGKIGEALNKDKESVTEFKKFIDESKDADKQLDKLQNKFSQISEEQTEVSKNLKEVNEAVKEVGATAKTIQSELDDFGIDVENIEIQKQVIIGLENELKNLQRQIEQLGSGENSSALLGKVSQIESELAQEKEVMAEFQKFMSGTEEAETQIDDLKNKFSALAQEQSVVSQELNEVADTLKDVGSTTKSVNNQLNDFGLNKENLEIQKQVIVSLENELKNLQKEISQMGQGDDQSALIGKARNIENELAAEKEAMQQFKKFISESKEADAQLDNLKDKFSQITQSQSTAISTFQTINQSIKGVGNTVKSVTTDFESFGIDQSNVEIQKQVIKDLENELKNLQNQIDKMAPGKAQSILLNEARELERELQAEKDALAEVEIAFNSNRDAAKQLSSEYETCMARLKELAIAGERNSEEYNELIAKVSEYREALSGLNEDLQDTSHNSLTAFVGLLTLLSSGLAVAQGTMALFSSENENLERIMVKIQAILAITVGLQEINNALNDRNAASTRALIAIQTLYTATNTRVAASLVAMGVASNVANVAAKALMATLTLGLTVAIAAILIYFEKWQNEQKELAEAQKKHAEAVADNAAEQMVAYKKLQIQWNSLADDLKTKQKFIDGNQEAFKKLGVEVLNVKDAENVLVKNTDPFVESLMVRAKAMAAAELATEKFKEYLIKKGEEDEKLSNPTIGQNIGQWWQMGVLGKSTEQYINEVHEDSEAAKKEFDNFIKMQVDFEKQKDEIYKKYGFREYLGKTKKDKKPKKEKELAETFDDGSVMKLQQQIMLIDAALQRMGKNGEVRLRAIDKYGKQYATKEIVSMQTAMDMRAKLMEQYEEMEKRIRIRKLSETLSEMEADWTNYYRAQKQFGDQFANEQFSKLKQEGMGMSFFDYLGIKQDELEKIGKVQKLTDEQAKSLDMIIQKRKELLGTQSDFDIFSENTSLKLDQIPTISDQIDYLIQQRDKLNNQQVDQGYYAYLEQEIDARRKELKSMVNQFIGTHRDFEVQRTEITGRYAKMREEIEKKTGLTEEQKKTALAALRKNQNEELSYVTSAKYQREHLEQELSANLLGITTRQFKSRIQTLKEFLASEISLTEEQKAKLQSELQKAEGFLSGSENNREEKILMDQKAQILKDINSLKSTGNALTVTENNLIINLLDRLSSVNEKLRNKNLDKYQKVAEWSSQIAGAFAGLVESVEDSNSALYQTLQIISELGSDVGSVIGAFQKGLVDGIVSLIATVLKWIGKLFTMGKRARESERQAAEELAKYQAEQFQAQLEYNAELRKRIAAEVKINDLYKSRVDNIKEEMEANKKNMAQVLKDQQMIFQHLLNAQTVTGMHSEKYGGIFGMGRKTKMVEEYKTIAELLGIGGSVSTGLFGQTTWITGASELTDELFEKLEKLNSLNPFTGAAKTMFDNLKKLRDEYGSIAELNKQLEIEMKNSVTGTTAQALADSIREGLESGKKSFADFADDIEGFLRNAILSGISAKMIEPKIQELQDALAEMMGDGILSADERKKFQEMYMSIVSQSQEYMDIINQAGVDLTTGTANANSLQGAFKSMSQESADIMSGQLGGLRLAQLETNQLIKSGTVQQLIHMSKMVELQIDIEKNTKRTADNTEKIHDVNENVEKVVQGQVQYYQALQAAGIIT